MKMVNILFLSIGALGICYFHEGIYCPVAISATIIGVAALSLMWLFQRSRIGVLVLLLFAAYALPFIHVFPYMWFDFDAAPPPFLWGLAVNP